RLAGASLIAAKQQMIRVISERARRSSRGRDGAPMQRVRLGESLLVIERNAQKAQRFGVVRPELQLAAKLGLGSGEFAALQRRHRVAYSGSGLRGHAQRGKVH